MNYTSLLAQVVDTLGSQVTTAQVDAMLPFVESRFNRIIDSPERETEAYITPTADIQLPADCWKLRDIWVMGTASSSVATSLVQVSPEQARALYAYQSNGMEAFSLTGRTIDFWPDPGATNTTQVRIRYQKTIPALTSSNTTNWLLTYHPDIYYYALLLQCEAYIVNDQRLPIWKSALDEAIGELSALSAKQRYAQAPVAPRPMRYDS